MPIAGPEKYSASRSDRYAFADADERIRVGGGPITPSQIAMLAAMKKAAFRIRGDAGMIFLVRPKVLPLSCGSARQRVTGVEQDGALPTAAAES
jgi:hypothetical protein